MMESKYWKIVRMHMQMCIFIFKNYLGEIFGQMHFIHELPFAAAGIISHFGTCS